MLDECLDYLQSRNDKDERFTYELIVVDDGSGDDTADVAFAYSQSHPQLRVLQLERNMGKGGAVREGTLCARGMLMLFADADGATRFADFSRLEREAWQLCNGEPPWSATKRVRANKGRTSPNEANQEESFKISTTGNPSASIDWTHPAVVVGSRAHLEESSKATRSFLRTFLMIGFHLLVQLLAVRSIRDTQCGFKLFTRAAAAKLFPRLHVERWAFDVELLYLAECLNYSLKEVAVEWKEIGASLSSLS
jgi:dolichyl-phosphate beta-glucosyltransferase